MEEYLPLDKSWIIRMGMLDLLNDKEDIITFLNKQENLGDDLLALKRIVEDWNSDKPLDVGESGTLYRFVRFVLWKQSKSKEIVKRGTLETREINNNPEVVNWPLARLLGLDNGTSQWASAAVLMGNEERLKDVPYHLNITYEALRHWNKQRMRDQSWIPIFDGRIKRQAKAFEMFLRMGFLDFKPEQPEDYCFARAFNLITKEEGEKRWPHMVHHETNRFEEMEIALEQAKNDEIVTSKDHRVIQAVVMLKKGNIKVMHPECVNKSWPKFWEFIKEIVE